MRLVDADALLKQMSGWEFGQTIRRKPQPHEMAAFEWTKNDMFKLVMNAPTIGGWISVKDRLPEETNCYLVHLINNYGIELDVYNVSDGRFHRNPGLVDYWMEILPLPEPPEEVSGDGQ